MMSQEEKIQLYREVCHAFDALCAVLFPNDKRNPRGMSQQLIDSCESTAAGLAIHKARLESEIGTDNL